MNVYKKIIRPLLFMLDGETAHNLAKALLRCPYLGWILGKGLVIRDERLQVQPVAFGFSNPVGLAAGFDKDCEMLDSLEQFGFGYLVAGSVTCLPRAGNPKPRIARIPEKKALVTCMGLPSKGLDYVASRLQKRRQGHVPLIINVNGFSLQEYVKCVEVLQPLVDGLEISLSCSNDPEAGGDFLDPRTAEILFTEIAARKQKPIFIKIPGYFSERERRKRFDLVQTALRYPIDGFTISTAGIQVEDKRLAMGGGSLSGRPLFPRMLELLRDIYEVSEGKGLIKVRGGIFSAGEAFEAIAAGATTVESYTGFVYEGWHLARNINRGLLALLEKHGIGNVTALRGTRIKINGSTQSY